MGEVREPLLKEWDGLDRIRVPEEALTVDIGRVKDFCGSTEQFTMSGCCPRPFERLQFIRKTENLYMDLAEQRPELFGLLKKIHEFYLKELEVWAKTDVDCLWFMDDWGTQRSLLISPASWRKIFKPLYKDYIDIAHKNHKYAFMHSDGYILDILPDLIEIGLDAINSQIFCMGVEEVGRRFKGKITFWGEMDRQYIIPHGTRDEVVGAVKKVRDNLYDNGGVIGMLEFGLGAKPENIYLTFETWNKML